MQKGGRPFSVHPDFRRILDCILVLDNITIIIIYIEVTLRKFVLDTFLLLMYLKGNRIYGYYEQL